MSKPALGLSGPANERMAAMPAGPSRPLAPQARWVWRGRLVFIWGIVFLATIVIGVPVRVTLDQLGWSLVAIAAFLTIVVAPEVAWRNWRWDVNPEAIEIRQGIVKLRLTRIPMPRVQHVETTQDVVERYLKLASVHVYTAAGKHNIALLPYDDADHLRSQISDLARTVDAP
jgi:membrane protein YdbS with pleckstrin-like domain